MSAKSPWTLPWPDRFGVFWQSHWPRLGPWLARLESRVLGEELAEVPIVQPVFIAGLPRSGSTILLEILADAAGFTAHRYADFPLLWTPYWWNWLSQRLPVATAAPVERAHRDRILVNRDSPEAFEEPLWQQAFPFLHQEQQSEILDADIGNPAFESLFIDHIRKLLLVRGAARYVSKGNYSLLRIGYLGRLFPDARFLVPLRAPAAHVASLIKQERLYADAPDAVLRHIGRIGHHEFGRQRRVLHAGDAAAFALTRTEFADGRLAQAWMRTWVQAYGWLESKLQQDPQLAERVQLVAYDRLCGDVRTSLAGIGAHIGLDADATTAMQQRWASRLSQPDYYQPESMQDVSPGLQQQAQDLFDRLHSRSV
jgi:Sulfotransferase family